MIINGESVTQTQEEDRCPNCAVGAVAQHTAVRVYEPEVPKTLRGMDPRLQSALAAVSALPEASREALGELVHAITGAEEHGAPAPPPTPVLPEGVEPMGVPSLGSIVQAPALPEAEDPGGHG